MPVVPSLRNAGLMKLLPFKMPPCFCHVGLFPLFLSHHGKDLEWWTKELLKQQISYSSVIAQADRTLLNGRSGDMGAG